MIRRLATPGAAVLLSKLREEAQTAWPKCLGLNEIDDGAQIGFYFEDGDAPSQAAINSLMSAHTATPSSLTPEETAFAASALQLRNTLGTTRNAAQINNSLDALTILLRRVFREL